MLIKNKYFRSVSVEEIMMNLLNKSILSIFLLLLVVTNITACLTNPINFDTGQELNTDTLETSLHLGKSDMKDVLQVLGKPNGKGRFMFPIDPTGRTTWSYYYEEGLIEVEAGPGGSLEDVSVEGESRRVFLFIYFNSSDKYDGYMWFSGANKISTQP